MAIEISFGVRGKNTKQALFINESDWETSLSEARKLIESQELHVPLRYKFLTLNGNAIPHPSEENLVLKKIATNFNRCKRETGDELPDLELKLEKDDSADIFSSPPEIWVTPLKVTLSSTTSPNVESEGESPEGATVEGERDPLLQEDGSGPRDTSVPDLCRTCPFKPITDSLQSEATPKTLLKILFGLTLVLFAGLASLTLTMHVLMKVFTGISQDPSFNEFFTKFHDGGSSAALTDLQVKFSTLEVSSKYEIERLHMRIKELEDLYLKDLAVHKRELNLLKQQVSQNRGEGGDMEGREEEDVWESPPSTKLNQQDEHHSNKQHGKKGRGKGSRKKG